MASADFDELAQLCSFPVNLDNKNSFERLYIYCFAKCVETACLLHAKANNDCLGCLFTSLSQQEHSCRECTRMGVIYRYFCEATDNFVKPETVEAFLHKIDGEALSLVRPSSLAQMYFGCQTVLRPAVFETIATNYSDFSELENSRRSSL